MSGALEASGRSGESPLRAMVLAAGEGERLRPLTLRLAKPAMPFVGVPILTRVLDALGEAGVEQAVVNLRRAPDSIRRVVAARGARSPVVSFSDESACLLGTAGALMPVRERFLDADFLLVNGDCVHAVDLSALLDTHRASGHEATLAVSPTGVAGFGSLLCDDEGRVRTFGAPTTGRPSERHFLSLMVLSPRLLSYLPDGPPRPLGTFGDWFPAALAAGCTFGTHETDAEWHAADTFERYLEATRLWLEARGSGPFVDEEADVAAGAELDAGCAIHAGASVGPGARLVGSVLLEGARVGGEAIVRNCLLGPGAMLREGEKASSRLVVAEDWR